MARTYFQLEDIDESKGNPWTHVSPSQITTSRTCLTKWFLSRRCPRSSSPATDLGTAVHAINEEYLLGSDKAPEDIVEDAELLAKALPIAKTMQPLLAKDPLPEDCVEAPIRYQPDGWPVPIVGFVDCVEPTGTEFADEVLAEGRITDEKTTSNWRYMKTPDELANDPQGILYSAWALGPDGPYSGQSHVEFRHVTAITKGSKAGDPDEGVRTVAHRFSRAEVEKRLAQMLPEVTRLKELSVLRWEEDAATIPHNNDACFKYGRCEFWDICKAAGKTPQRKKTEEQEMAMGLASLVMKLEEDNAN